MQVTVCYHSFCCHSCSHLASNAFLQAPVCAAAPWPKPALTPARRSVCQLGCRIHLVSAAGKWHCHVGSQLHLVSALRSMSQPTKPKQHYDARRQALCRQSSSIGAVPARCVQLLPPDAANHANHYSTAHKAFPYEEKPTKVAGVHTQHQHAVCSWVCRANLHA